MTPDNDRRDYWRMVALALVAPYAPPKQAESHSMSQDRRIALFALGVACFSVAFAASRLMASHAPEHEAVAYVGSTACGLERWSIKTGTDTGAKSISLTRITPTTILHLRSLHAPPTLPARTRVKPTETTVFRVSAYLTRFKKETDSDYHLVLSDAGGRTMIAEIPAPDCVGASSPFLRRITTARATFDRHYRVSGTWHRVHAAVTVTGVGFFDFKHGQSGVAPNAIELHPVLSITFGTPPQPPTPGPMP